MTSKPLNNRYHDSLWSIFTTASDISNEHLELSDFYLLMRHEDTLKFRQNGDTIMQMLAFYRIQTPHDYYRFNNVYLIDNSVKQGQLPTKLKNEFYMFTNRLDALKALEHLRKKQDQYYDALPSDLKALANKTDLGVTDILPYYMKFSGTTVLDDVMKSKGAENNDKTHKTN